MYFNDYSLTPYVNLVINRKSVFEIWFRFTEISVLKCRQCLLLPWHFFLLLLLVSSVCCPELLGCRSRNLVFAWCRYFPLFCFRNELCEPGSFDVLPYLLCVLQCMYKCCLGDCVYTFGCYSKWKLVIFLDNFRSLGSVTAIGKPERRLSKVPPLTRDQ